MTQPLETPKPSASIRLLLVDVHSISRKSSHILLDALPEFCVVGETGEHNEALRMATTLKPDVVLISMRVQGSSGPETTREILRLMPGIRVVFWTLFKDPEHIRSALAAGSMGYVLKQDPVADMRLAIMKSLKGERYFSPSLNFTE